MMLHHFEITNRIFKTQQLDMFDMALSLGIAMVPMLLVEGLKVVKNRRE